jgi:hypothetical protein
MVKAEESNQTYQKETESSLCNESYYNYVLEYIHGKKHMDI